MGARAKPKAWGDRLPLDDIRGLRLLGAAIFHATCLQHERAVLAASELLTVQCEMIDCADPRQAIARILSRVDRAEFEMRLWRSLLARLDITDDELAAGEAATLQDFIFDPADLWRHKQLALFVVEGQADSWPDFDRDTPICRNPDLWPRDDLRELFDQYFRWHLAPPHAKPILNLDFGHQIEHVHWRNYLAPFCEEPRGRGHPEGPRWHDGRRAAASYAWSLLHEASEVGQGLSISEAVRRSIACFKILNPSDPQPDRRAAEGFIRATSRDQAEKSVRKILEEIIDREPPWVPAED
jgi:hypothetical protein